jgi:hypothetical protein
MRIWINDKYQGIQVSPDPAWKHITLEQIGITSRQGDITSTRRILEETFGPPTFDDPAGSRLSSSTVEWDLQFSDGVVAAIYDTDVIDSATGEVITPGADELYEWHIGGTGPEAVTRDLDALNQGR